MRILHLQINKTIKLKKKHKNKNPEIITHLQQIGLYKIAIELKLLYMCVKTTLDSSRSAFSLTSGLLRSRTSCSAVCIFRSMFAGAPTAVDEPAPPKEPTFIVINKTKYRLRTWDYGSDLYLG